MNSSIKIVLKQKRVFWYWVLSNGRNGSVLATSETYMTKYNANRGAKRAAKDLGVTYVGA